MTYQYKAPVRVVQPPQAALIKKQSPPIIQTPLIVKQSNKAQLRIYESVLIIIDLLIKKKRKKLVKESFNKLKITIARRVKYSNFIAKKLQILFRVKHKNFIQNAFQNLITNSISTYKQQLIANQKQKTHIKQRVTAIIFYALQKFQKKRLSSTFSDLKFKGNLYFKTKNFKIKHLISRISVIKRSKIQQAFSKLLLKSSRINIKCKLLARIQKFFKIKGKRSLTHAFHKLKINLLKSRQNSIIRQAKIKQQKTLDYKQVNKKDNTASLQSQHIEMQKKQQILEKQLKAAQHQQKAQLKQQRETLSSLQKQKQSLHFSNQLLDQSNLQLQLQIKQLSNLLIPRKKLPKHQVWQSVYNHLIFYLQTNKHRTVTKQEILKAMETPLVPIQGTVEQIRQENQILQDLLHQYQKCFPQPQNINHQTQNIVLPFDVLKTQNRYYLMVLEVLAEWGQQGSPQLQQLSHDLQALQNKINSN